VAAGVPGVSGVSGRGGRDVTAAVPGARHAFHVIHPGSSMLRVRYRDGVVVDGHGFPDWLPYARAVVELPEPAPHRTADETRVLDVLIANEVMAGAGDPWWPDGGEPLTPDGWTWAHVAMTRRLALVPVELHGAFRHAGGVATMRADYARRGLDLAGAEPMREFGSDRGLTDAAVDKVEDRLGYRLPEAYRRFLAATNGGRPVRPALHPGFGFVLDQRFFGLARQDWLQDLVYANDWFRDRLTADHLAVSYLQGGLLVLKVRGDDAGSVWYWDDDDPRDTDDHGPAEVCERLLHRLADDLDAFGRALRAVPYPLRRLARDTVARGDARRCAPEGMGASLPRTKRAGGA